MDTVVLKFGGSSVADNIKLNIVAEKIKEFYLENKKIVVVVSAQGDTTDKLIKEAMSLASMPNERELDVLLSCGEQITISKLSILLNRIGMKAISLTGWQAGIYTNNTNQDATIENIDTTRIINELNNNNIVIVAGFQGINEKLDITTLGRGGSDTTALAIAAKLKANACYIFSDVDGVYSADPNKTKIAKKIDNISYSEMIEIADEGAKVLHNRSIQIGQRFNVPIVAKSTFLDSQGTKIDDRIEGSFVKSIVKNDNLQFVNLNSDIIIDNDKYNEIYDVLIKNELKIENIFKYNNENHNINFTIPKQKFNKLSHILEERYNNLNVSCIDISKISIIGNGIMSNNNVLNKLLNFISDNKLEILNIQISEIKISIIFKEMITDTMFEKLHKEIIN